MKNNRSTNSRIEVLKLEIITLIIKEKNLSFDEAKEEFETSLTNQLLMNISTNIYLYPKEKVFALWKREKQILSKILSKLNSKNIEEANKIIIKELLATNLDNTIPSKDVKKKKTKTLSKHSIKQNLSMKKEQNT